MTGFAKTENAEREVTFSTVVKTIAPWWQVEGEWLQDGDTQRAIVGAALARKMGWAVGDEFTAWVNQRSARFKVLGVIKTGGFEEDQVFVSLPATQALLGMSNGAERVLVSALVEPEEKLRPDLRKLDPTEMTPEQYVTWFCSPIMAAVVKQIQEILPDMEVGPIRQVSKAEAGFLTRIGLLMTLLTLTALAMMTTMTASVMERRGEIGLMKAIGADNLQVAAIFLSESTLIGLAGGGAGYVLGLVLAQVLSRWVFSMAGQVPIMVLPVTLLLALGVALFGRQCGSNR